MMGIGILFIACLIVHLIGLVNSNWDGSMKPREWDGGTITMAVSFAAMLLIAIWAGTIYVSDYGEWPSCGCYK